MSDIYILGECYRKTQTHSIYLPWLGLEKKQTPPQKLLFGPLKKVLGATLLTGFEAVNLG